MEKQIKVAMSQRICPEWRVPVFRELARRNGLDFTLFFGKGLSTGANRNGTNISGFKFEKLPTLRILVPGQKENERYRVLHPTLPIRLLRGLFDVVISEPTSNFFNNLLIYPLCKFTGKKFIWYEVGIPPERTHYRKIIDPIVNRMIHGADAFVTYNSFADESLIEKGIPHEKIFRAQNTLDTSQLSIDVENYRSHVPELKRQLGIEDANVALFIGGIEKRKRIDNLIGAVKILRNEGVDVFALIVGDGPYQATLESNLLSEDREFTIFAGRHVEDAVLYILASDVVVLPGEGGLSINHAFGCGKPCIATQESVAGGNTVYDYVHDNKNGFVARSNDVQDLANRLRNIFSDNTRYTKLCNGALESARELTVGKMVDGIENAIKYSMAEGN